VHSSNNSALSDLPKPTKAQTACTRCSLLSPAGLHEVPMSLTGTRPEGSNRSAGLLSGADTQAFKSVDQPAKLRPYSRHARLTPTPNQQGTIVLPSDIHCHSDKEQCYYTEEDGTRNSLPAPALQHVRHMPCTWCTLTQPSPTTKHNPKTLLCSLPMKPMY
jgi:hypothetical protein